MHYIFFFILCVFSLCEASGIFSSPGLGLYVDAAFSPVWRDSFDTDAVLVKDSFLATSGICTSGIHTPGICTSGILGCYTLTDPIFKMSENENLYSPGVRFSADLSANRETSLQGVFLGFYKWEYSKEIDNGGYFMGFCVNPYQDVPALNCLVEDTFKEFTQLDFMYNEDFNSAEGNILCNLSPRYYDYVSVTFLFGVRAMRYRNELSLGGIPPVIPGAPFSDIPAQIYLKNSNRFIGPQIGGDFRYRMTNSTYFCIPVKFAMYADVIDYLVQLTYPIPYGAGQVMADELAYLDKQKTTAGYSVESTPQFEIHAGPFYFKLGVSILWIYGISPTYMQIADCTLNKVVEHAQINLYGLTLGGGLHF
jgi:hypothetical protein